MYLPNLQGSDIWQSIISDYKCINALIMYLKSSMLIKVILLHVSKERQLRHYHYYL